SAARTYCRATRCRTRLATSTNDLTASGCQRCLCIIRSVNSNAREQPCSSIAKGERRYNRQKIRRGTSLTESERDRNVPDSEVSRGLRTGQTPDSFFRNLLDAAPDAMVVVDADGRIAVVNKQAEKMFGYSRERMVGENIEMLLPHRYRARHIRHRAGYVDAPRVRPMGVGMELVGLRRDGTEFPVEISLSPINSGADSFVSSVIRDVTERHQIEQALNAARQTAERAQKANNAFLAAASHDLRQPLQALSLLSGALRRTIKDPLALEMIQSQQDSLEAMTTLLNSLLDISRL